MKQAYQKVQKVYREEGPIQLLKKGSKYLYRNNRLKVENRLLFTHDWYIDLLIWRNSGRGSYEAIADPFKVLWIDPTEVQYVTGRGPHPGKFQLQDIGRIKDGTWDQENKLFADLPVVEAIRERYVEETPWREVDYVRERLNDTETRPSVLEWCESVELLYDSVLEHGYLRRENVAQSAEGVFKPTDNKEYNLPASKRFSEVKVDIGREGSLQFVNGRHRLAIAQVINVDKIPVRVVVRHSEWQKVRDKVLSNESVPNDLYSHPDLHDLQ